MIKKEQFDHRKEFLHARRTSRIAEKQREIIFNSIKEKVVSVLSLMGVGLAGMTEQEQYWRSRGLTDSHTVYEWLVKYVPQLGLAANDNIIAGNVGKMELGLVKLPGNKRVYRLILVLHESKDRGYVLEGEQDVQLYPAE